MQYMILKMYFTLRKLLLLKYLGLIPAVHYIECLDLNSWRWVQFRSKLEVHLGRTRNFNTSIVEWYEKPREVHTMSLTSERTLTHEKVWVGKIEGGGAEVRTKQRNLKYAFIPSPEFKVITSYARQEFPVA